MTMKYFSCTGVAAGNSVSEPSIEVEFVIT